MVRPANLQDAEFQGLRGQIAKFIEKKAFTYFITLVILINAVTLGLETNKDITAQAGNILGVLDNTALAIFIVEILLKLYVYRVSFFRAGWNVFDFLIVSIAIIPTVGAFSVLRTLRIVRVLRLVSVVPQMRRVIAALFHAIPGMASVIAVLLIIFYVASVMVTNLFGEVQSFDHLFGSVGASMYTLFQIMTLEGWSEEIVRPVMNVYPWSWMFFIPFIIITSFAVLNLFIGIIVDAMNYVHDASESHTDDYKDKDGTSLHQDLRDMKQEIMALRTLLEEKES